MHVFSLTSHAISYSLRAHSDTIASLALSPNSSQLLSCGMDSTLHLWTVQPFAPTVNAANPALHPRLVRSFYGAPAGFEQLLRKACFSRHVTPEGQTGTMVAAGGADRALTVWDATTGEIRYKVRSLTPSLFPACVHRPRAACSIEETPSCVAYRSTSERLDVLRLTPSLPSPQRSQLPGHTGSVTATDFSPKEPILASGGVEGVIYLGEVDAA